MNTTAVVWQWHAWESLGRDDLYAMLQLRQDVFVVEQRCAYPDIDDQDRLAWHLLGWSTDPERPGLIATARILSPGIKTAGPAIGRVAVHPHWRKQGIGRTVLQECTTFCQQNFPGMAVQLSAQSHLQAFYAEWGFVAVSAIYEEDGIPHIDMRREAVNGER